MVKKLSYELVPKDTPLGERIYEMLDELVNDYHEELAKARIAIAWNTSWKPDVDGRLKLGACKRASDLDRELAAFDFVVVLNKEFWMSPQVSTEQHRALLDHELSHGAMKCDSEGEPVLDEKERPVYRIRKHDLEEFSAVVRRHGCYKRDIEDFAAALRASSKQPSLFEPKEEDVIQVEVDDDDENDGIAAS